jgi:Helix-turn-helix domain/RodZ C-terminal domain
VFEIGNSLREARVRQQLEFAELEQATKIRARYLRALEEESFDTLPAQTYVKGFLRTYADYLGLDGQLYVDEYNSRFSTGEEEHREPVVARRTSNVGAHHRRVESRWVLVALAAIGTVFALVIAAWKFGGTGTQKIPNPAPDTTPAATPTVEQKTQPKPKPVTFRLYLRASHGNSWMDVRSWSVNGGSRYTGTLELGQAQRFVAKRLWINFGNPGNLSIALNGKPVSVSRGGAYLVRPGGITRAA